MKTKQRVPLLRGVPLRPKRMNRSGNGERLVMALKNLDSICLGDLDSYEKLLDEMMDYQDRVSSTGEVLRAMADLIEEAMETEGFNLR